MWSSSSSVDTDDARSFVLAQPMIFASPRSLARRKKCPPRRRARPPGPAGRRRSPWPPGTQIGITDCRSLCHHQSNKQGFVIGPKVSYLRCGISALVPSPRRGGYRTRGDRAQQTRTREGSPPRRPPRLRRLRDGTVWARRRQRFYECNEVDAQELTAFASWCATTTPRSSAAPDLCSALGPAHWRDPIRQARCTATIW